MLLWVTWWPGVASSGWPTEPAPLVELREDESPVDVLPERSAGASLLPEQEQELGQASDQELASE